MKGTIFIMIALAVMPFVMAVNSYDMNSFEQEPVQAEWLKPHDEMRFEMLGGVHSLFLEQINEEKQSVKVKIFPFRTRANYVTLVKGKNNVKADFDKDGQDDILIRLYEIKGGRAMILLAKLDTSTPTGSVIDITSIPDSPPEGQGVVKKESSAMSYITAGIALLMIASFFLRRRKKK